MYIRSRSIALLYDIKHHPRRFKYRGSAWKIQRVREIEEELENDPYAQYSVSRHEWARVSGKVKNPAECCPEIFGVDD